MAFIGDIPIEFELPFHEILGVEKPFVQQLKQHCTDLPHICWLGFVNTRDEILLRSVSGRSCGKKTGTLVWTSKETSKISSKKKQKNHHKRSHTVVHVSKVVLQHTSAAKINNAQLCTGASGLHQDVFTLDVSVKHSFLLHVLCGMDQLPNHTLNSDTKILGKKKKNHCS